MESRALLLFSALVLLLMQQEGQGMAAIAPAPSTLAAGGAVSVQSPSPGTTFYFDSTVARGPLSCNPTEHAPGFITTLFLRNGPYDFGCLSYDLPGSYYLSVVVSYRNFPNVPVWMPNRERPVTDNATLKLTPAGDVELLDLDGSRIWHSSTAGVVGMTLTAKGNLIFFDGRNATVWDSFNEPLDVLVPGQSLKPGQSLVARGSSSTSFSSGSFKAVMYPGGVVFFEFSSSEPVPYYAIKYPYLVSTVEDILSSPCNGTVLQLNSTYLTQIQQPGANVPSCTPPTSTNFIIQFDSPVAFVRLDTDGNPRGYHADHSPSVSMFENTTRGLCGLPNVCGSYGICNHHNNSCTCPGNQSSIYFTQSNLPTSNSCSPVVTLNCDKTHEQEFLEVRSMDYFANDFMRPTIPAITPEACKAACAANCSCKAAFHRGKTRDCFLHGEVLSMMQVSHADYVAFVKFQLPSDKTNSELKLIVGISVALGLLLLLFALWLYFKGTKSKGHHKSSKDHDDLMLLSALPGQPKRFKFRELRKGTADFSQKLGVGGFGSVYWGMLSDGSKIAVKQLENTTKTAQGLKEFRAEVIALSNINHQNLVHLRGFCADGSHRLLVYEYVPNGSLDTWLFCRKSSDSRLDWSTRLSIAIHTARGLFFLHEQCRNCIVHLDIKPQNILLDDKFVAKLSDFGLARLINEDNSSAVTRMRGTPGYMAPECLIVSDATEKSDVYSFGMVLLEIVSGRKNVDMSRLVLHGDSEGWYFPALAAKKYKEGHIEEIVDNTLCSLSEEKMEEVKRVIKVAFWCIQDEPSLRPTMGNVLHMLQGYTPVPEPPISINFGLRFHMSNTITSSPPTLSNLEHHVQVNGQHDGEEMENKGVVADLESDKANLSFRTEDPLLTIFDQTQPSNSPTHNLSSLISSPLSIKRPSRTLSHDISHISPSPLSPRVQLSRLSPHPSPKHSYSFSSTNSPCHASSLPPSRHLSSSSTSPYHGSSHVSSPRTSSNMPSMQFLSHLSPNRPLTEDQS